MGKPLHIAIALDHLGSSGGGAQRQAVELAIELARRPGVCTSVLVYHNLDFFRERLQAARIPVVCFPKRAKIDPSLPLRVARWLSENAIDVVHAFLPYPGLWYLCGTCFTPPARRPAFVSAERSMPSHESNFTKMVLRFIYTQSDAVTANSEPAAREIREWHGIDARRVHYIPNGINLVAWDRQSEVPGPVRLEEEAFHIALVGRVSQEKNHALLLEALTRIGVEHLHDWRVWFIGDVTGVRGLADRLLQDVVRRNLERVVRFLPPIPNIASFIVQVNAIVQPSRFEGFPNVLLESMACGIPSVATRVGDVANMIEDGVTGFVIPTEDADGLARALRRVYDMSAAERTAMGTRARAIVEERYQIRAIADRYLALYQALA
jgi:glycosyltransferase involved in cell wall biosynthesis